MIVILRNSLPITYNVPNMITRKIDYTLGDFVNKKSRQTVKSEENPNRNVEWSVNNRKSCGGR